MTGGRRLEAGSVGRAREREARPMGSGGEAEIAR
jgi:hypothetical protein